MSGNFTSNDAVNANANEKVTISLYSKEYSKDSKQYKEGTKYNRACFEELENVIRISEGLSDEAKSQGKVPPEVEVLFLLIPSEDKINKASVEGSYSSYNDNEYKEAKKEFIDSAKSLFSKNGIKVGDSYEILSEDERKYLEGNKSTGSSIDLVKHRSIINHKGKNHLQLDSNVAVSSFQDLYELTFKQNNDSFYASRDSKYHISTQNKIVYTGKEGAFAEKLEEVENSYIKSQLSKGTRADSNDIYDKVFTKAMHEIGSAYKYRGLDSGDPPLVVSRYAARVEDEKYQLSKCIIPGKRQTWNSKKGVDPFDNLKVSVSIEGQEYDIKNFQSLIVTFTDIPSWTLPPKKKDALDEQYDMMLEDYSSRMDGINLNEANRSFDTFLGRQNKDRCMEIMSGFYNKTLEHSDSLDDPSKGKILMDNLARTIPESTAGQKLCSELFNCNVNELRLNPKRLSEYQVIPKISVPESPTSVTAISLRERFEEGSLKKPQKKMWVEKLLSEKQSSLEQSKDR